jgi:long-chain acyl-CoA synthetase
VKEDSVNHAESVLELAPHTLGELLAHAASEHPDRIALSSMGVDLSYRYLLRRSRSFAGWILAQGMRPGERVAVVLPNVLTHPIACFGAMIAGLSVVCVNPLYTAAEMAHLFQDSEVSMIVVFEPMASTVLSVLPAASLVKIVVVAPGDELGFRRPLINLVARHVRKMVPVYDKSRCKPWSRATSGRICGAPNFFDQLPEQDALMLYSGGTTGNPKGVPMTHRGLLYNVAQQEASLGKELAVVPGYTVLLAMPLYHILGFGNLLFSIYKGGTAILIPNPRDHAAFLKEWGRHQVTAFPAVNTLFNSLLNLPNLQLLDFSKMIFVLGAGMPVQASTAKKWSDLTGCGITEAYGMTETGLLTCNPVGRSREGSVGKAIPGVTLSLRDDQGCEAPVGEPGEVCVRSHALMRGYWRNPEENATAFTHDGYFRTGDIGVLDADGYLRLVDRKKEMIICSGFKVFPSEVERVICAHEGVLECAVVPGLDAKAGEVPVAYVVPAASGVSERELSAFCEANLAGYKRPRKIVIVRDLPKSNVGKILRKELRRLSIN